MTLIRSAIFAMTAFLAVIAFGPASAVAHDKAVVVVTGDDSAGGFYEFGFPITERLGIVGTLFVEPSCHGVDPWCLTIAEVKAFVAAGWEAANHSYHHVHLTELSAAKIKAEIENGADAIFKQTGQRPVSFAAPYCDINDAVVKAAVDAGHLYNILECGAETFGFNPLYGLNPLEISRFVIKNEVNADGTLKYEMTAADVCNAVDRAVTEGSLLVLLVHDTVADDKTPGEWETRVSVFEGAMACVAAARDKGDILVKTLEDAAAEAVKPDPSG